MDEVKNRLSTLAKFKYPLIVLALGMAIMLLPSRFFAGEAVLNGETGLAQLLSCTEGVGEARVILSENGVVVVCRGADDPKVRLDIIQAIGSYTGFGSDKITVLKMTEQ